MSCKPASYQNLKNSRNSGRFWNSPPTGASSTQSAFEEVGDSAH
jgi:hypothetical protein